jgi:hypothetical protein
VSATLPVTVVVPTIGRDAVRSVDEGGLPFFRRRGPAAARSSPVQPRASRRSRRRSRDRRVAARASRPGRLVESGS